MPITDCTLHKLKNSINKTDKCKVSETCNYLMATDNLRGNRSHILLHDKQRWYKILNSIEQDSYGYFRINTKDSTEKCRFLIISQHLTDADSLLLTSLLVPAV